MSVTPFKTSKESQLVLREFKRLLSVTSDHYLKEKEKKHYVIRIIQGQSVEIENYCATALE